MKDGQDHRSVQVRHLRGLNGRCLTSWLSHCWLSAALLFVFWLQQRQVIRKGRTILHQGGGDQRLAHSLAYSCSGLHAAGTQFQIFTMRHGNSKCAHCGQAQQRSGLTNVFVCICSETYSQYRELSICPVQLIESHLPYDSEEGRISSSEICFQRSIDKICQTLISQKWTRMAAINLQSVCLGKNSD